MAAHIKQVTKIVQDYEVRIEGEKRLQVYIIVETAKKVVYFVDMIGRYKR